MVVVITKNHDFHVAQADINLCMIKEDLQALHVVMGQPYVLQNEIYLSIVCTFYS